MIYDQKRLRQEKSPYLQLHAQDPVLWQAWDEQALAIARSEDKLILLSIGYLACHWCHVMAVESYHDTEVAKLLNDKFVPILVDREERPDLDQYFLKVCRTFLDGNGGWPLNVILTPSLVPVFTCIYLPKCSRGQGPGFLNILIKYNELWESDPAEINKNGQLLLQKLKEEASRCHGHCLQKKTLGMAVSNLRREYDAAHSGFGPEPKFIMPHRLLFLLHRYRRTGEADILAMVEKTCEAMRRGGVYDQLGSGVHRYSTDIFWFEPHFEKMTYDQAGLIQVYASLWALTGKARYARTCEDLVAYLAREMVEKTGCFAAAQDADSEGKDGKFYLWSRQEIMEVLGEHSGERFCQVFGVTGKGNFRPGMDGNGLNILAQKDSFTAWAEKFGTDEPTLRQQIRLASQKLFSRREQRPAPAKDTLVVTAWNGLTISALAAAGQIFGKRTWVAMAARAANFFSAQLNANEVLSHSYLGGAGDNSAFASDYVFLAKGYLDLYRATLQGRWLMESAHLFKLCLGLFWDEQEGGLLETSAEAFSAPFAVKSMDERDLPSVNAVALDLCCWLAFVSGNQEWQGYADRIVATLGGGVDDKPEQYPAFLAGYGHYVEPLRKVVIAGKKGAADTQALLRVARKCYDPETIVLLSSTLDKDNIFAAAAPPFAHGKAAAYICDSAGCYAPIGEAEQLHQELVKAPALPIP